MYGGENSGMPLGADPVNNGTGTFGADDNYDQPAAIISGGEDGGAVAFDSSNKSNNNSAKFFGRRSRESATRADAAQTQANAELAAASSIASNPNNPDFFRQAAAENATSQIQRQPRQINKKPFIIGGIVLLIGTLVACFVVFLLPLLNRPYPDGMTAETIAETLTNENIETVRQLEQMIQKSVANPLFVSDSNQTKSERIVKTMNEELDVYKGIYETISKYEAVQYREDTVSYFENAKMKMEKMIPIYEGIIKRYELVTNVAYKGADVGTISSLEGYNSSLLSDISAHRNEEDSDEDRFDLRKIIFGSDTEDIRSGKYMVRKDLRAIQYAPENKTVGDYNE